tara:strand:+ start:23105 stop:24796 length:1692 start_codon:yes stop_codon:yes gene_type:complete
MNKSYQPLHLKYRPFCFDDLVGQDAVKETLKQAIKSNRIAPAYLFSGPRGTGKTSSARILARSLNCISNEKPTISPCGKCELCKAIKDGSSLDIFEIDAASNTGVDNIRELIEGSRFAPVQARWKIYVIDECHMLSTAAFNALLKTLEEPPLYVVFILATTDPQRVLPTIISRCQRFEFRQIPLPQLINHLKYIAEKENIAINEEAINLIAQKAEGGLRDAQRLLDQLSLLPQPITRKSVWNLVGGVPEKELLNMTKALTFKETNQLLRICRSQIEAGKDPTYILNGITTMLRDLILIYSAPDDFGLTCFSKEVHAELYKISQKIGMEKLLTWQEKLKGTEFQIRNSSQPQLWIEVILLSLLAERKSDIKETTKEIKNTTKTTINKNNSSEVNQTIQSHFAEEKTEISEMPANILESNSQNLDELWTQILGQLELPSTRMLLSQQAKLYKINDKSAFIKVNSNWISMVQGRSAIVEKAIEKTLKKKLKIIIESSIENKQKIGRNKHIASNKSTANRELNTNTMSNEAVQEKPEIEKNNENIDNNAKQFADFFNGKVLEIEESE